MSLLTLSFKSSNHSAEKGSPVRGPETLRQARRLMNIAWTRRVVDRSGAAFGMLGVQIGREIRKKDFSARARSVLGKQRRDPLQHALN